MAKIRTSALVSRIHGSMNGSNISSTPNGSVLSNIRRPANTKPTTHYTYKAVYAYLMSIWHTLTEEEVWSWRNTSFSKAYSRTLFIKLNYNIYLCGKQILRQFINHSYPGYADSFDIFISKFYNSLLLQPHFALPSNIYIKVKASKQYKSAKNITSPTFKELCVLSDLASYVTDIMSYYSSRYPASLISGYYIFIQISTIDINTGCESTPFTYLNQINTYLDIVLGDGEANASLFRSRNNFNTVESLISVAGANFIYWLQRLSNSEMFFTTNPLGRIYRSKDKMQSFSYTTINPNAAAIYPSITDYKNLTAFNSGNAVKSHVTKSDGNSWFDINYTAVATQMLDIKRLASGRILISSFSSVASFPVFYTDDSFNTIHNCIGPAYIGAVRSMVVLSNTELVACFRISSTLSYIIRSSDAGLTWSVVYTLNKNINEFFPSYLGNGIICYGLSTVAQALYSVDRGITWSLSNTIGSYTVLRGIFRFDNNNYVGFAGQGTYIVLSTDNCSSWSTVYSGPSTGASYVFIKVSATCAIAFIGTSKKVVITYNSGLNWSEIYTFANNTSVISAFIDNQY